ncbi:hypothetical protein C8F01DRAFT_1173098 [Mycena amicta]|nr:hypothetical protein C8F01DRAFT_1173098 [Mycena amicta]
MTPSSELRSQIAEAETRIADLERQLTELRAHETRLKAELGAIVYPILTIPAEITAEILCHVASSCRNEWLLAATSVCALWRSIALSTPRLWNVFNNCPGRGRPYRIPTPLLQRWLPRSGRLPLNLTVRVQFDGEHNVALAEMAKHISRWRRVILFQTTCWHGGLDEEQPRPSLALHGDVPLPNLDADSCPKWRSVVLCGSSIVPSALLPLLANVTYLTLHNVASAVVSRVLLHTTAVEILSVEASHLEFPIVLPLVHTLYHGAPALLHHLTLPALKNLHISRWCLPPPEALKRFLARSRCTLQLVHLENCRENGVLGLLHTLPSFTDLTVNLHDSPADDNKIVLTFLDAFAEGAILAGVERARLLHIPSNILPEVHSALLRKIRLPTCRLKKLTVELHRRGDDVVTESLQLALAEKGIELEVIYEKY